MSEPAASVPKRGPQTRAGDTKLTSDIRRLVEARPSYGYRRIAAADARTALLRIDHWMEDYNCASEHPSVYVVEEKRFC
ncbi:hypothetical protein GCM10007857_90620 [Bradyrhizobium iriomotense]|uniref:Integrase catalytic domain-containing protein n=1 Tax=Bradyrhizobium iriomotense TaxID=441950 RepID=A0ABQ6BES3_9BRAD|nr:hypothetical protein GCM10007857_90620 [Bradyrhizobium iriomotense]